MSDKWIPYCTYTVPIDAYELYVQEYNTLSIFYSKFYAFFRERVCVCIFAGLILPEDASS